MEIIYNKKTKKSVIARRPVWAGDEAISVFTIIAVRYTARDCFAALAMTMYACTNYVMNV